MKPRDPRTFYVWYRERGADLLFVADCAEDEAHAREQCADANPEGSIYLVTDVTPNAGSNRGATPAT